MFLQKLEVPIHVQALHPLYLVHNDGIGHLNVWIEIANGMHLGMLKVETVDPL